MKKTDNDVTKQSQGSMLNQKTNEDFNKQKPNPQAPNFKTKTTYTCTRHPKVKMDKPGKCPQCGMELAENK